MPRMKGLLRIIPLLSLAVLLLVTPVLAYSYSASITVVESDSNSYTMLPITLSIDNQYLVDNEYISSSGLDTRVLAVSTPIPHMLADGRLLFASGVSADESPVFTYTFGNEALDAFYIILGYNGYITVSDAAALELGNNFEIEQDGYVATDSGSDKNLVYKQDAFRTYVSDSGNITSEISDTTILTLYSTTSDGYLTGDGGGNWNSVRDAASALAVDSSSTYFYISGRVSTGDYYIGRSAVYFETGVIPDDAYIVSVTLSLWGSSIDEADMGIVIQSGMPTYPSDPLVLSDYDRTKYSGNGGEISTVAEAQYNDIILNATGRDWINKTGDTKFFLRDNKYDFPNVTPSVNNHNSYSSSNSASNKPKLVVTYSLPVIVTATGVSSGEHKVKTTADGTNLKVYVDDVEKDSTALGGASVPDNSNDWTFLQNNVMPYMEFYKHTVSDTQILWYQPNTMIIGTVLPDREVDSGTADDGTTTTLIDDALTEADDYWNNVTLEILTTTDGEAPQGESAIITDFVAVDDELQFDALTAAVEVGDTYELRNDGVFMWGSNPTGIAVSIDGLVATGIPPVVTPELPTPVDVLPELPGVDLFTESAGENIPIFYPFFKIASDTSGWPIQLFWIMGALTLAAVAGALALILFHSLLLSGFVVGAALAVACTIDGGVVSWWVFYIYVIMAVTFWIYQRVVSV